MPSIYGRPDSPPHWSSWPHNIRLYATDPRFRRLFDEWDGFIEPRPLPTPEEQTKVKACPHHRPCPLTNCLQATCAAGKGRGPTHEVDVYDCLSCLNTSEPDGNP